MRILVGTLYTIENEYEDCVNSIRDQTYKNYEHLVIRNLPKKEAHDTLYQTFMDNSGTYDILIKIDADMVLCRDDLFERIVERFTGDPELDLLLIAVHDFFTDDLLLGMNIFRNTVQWNKNKDDLITDRIYDPGTIRKKEKDYHELAPAAIHCPNPGPYQAFHFGFHRGMKAVRRGGNWGIVQALFNRYRKNPNNQVVYALLGVKSAFTNRFSIENISYSDDTLYNFFKEKYSIPKSKYIRFHIFRD